MGSALVDRGRSRVAAIVFGSVLVTAMAGSLAGCEDASAPATATPNPVDAQLEVLRTGTESERAMAAFLLADLADPRAIPALVAALGDVSWQVRDRAAGTLVTLHDTTAVDPLLKLVAVAPASPPISADDLPYARAAYESAIEALGAIGDVRAVSRLIEIAAVEQWTLTSGGAEDALAAIGTTAAPGLVAALSEATPAVGAVIVGIIGRLGSAGFDPLAAALSDVRSEVGVAAAAALAEYGAEAVDPLLAVLGSKDGAVRAAAATSLGKLGDPKATGPLVGLLADGETNDAATWALVRLHEADASSLVPYLGSKATVGVYRPLIRIGQDDTVAPLVKALKSYGAKAMATVYLNCGNPTLEQAAEDWAKAHGFTVVAASPGTGPDGWGAK